MSCRYEEPEWSRDLPRARTSLPSAQDPAIGHMFSVTRRGAETVAGYTVSLMEKAALVPAFSKKDEAPAKKAEGGVGVRAAA